MYYSGWWHLEAWTDSRRETRFIPSLNHSNIPRRWKGPFKFHLKAPVTYAPYQIIIIAESAFEDPSQSSFRCGVSAFDCTLENMSFACQSYDI
ncbi:hypothetical protein EAE99_003949 [Botrytis elliptica]|nr:hypothetical protein EAE99_003949 [Botrytis elliptica]